MFSSAGEQRERSTRKGGKGKGACSPALVSEERGNLGQGVLSFFLQIVGTESSHMHSATDLDYQRGYEYVMFLAVLYVTN